MFKCDTPDAKMTNTMVAQVVLNTTLMQAQIECCCKQHLLMCLLVQAETMKQFIDNDELLRIDSEVNRLLSEVETKEVRI